MPITSSTNCCYNASRAMADGLKSPFYQWKSYGDTLSFIFAIIFKAPLMILGLIASLPFRQISIWSSPKEGFVTTETEVKSKECLDKISVLSYNILGMPSYHAAKEQRPDIDQRLEKIFEVIDKSDADVVMLQEVHAGSELEQKIIEHYKTKYSKFYHDMGPKTFFLGSGLMVLSKFNNVDFEFHAFNEAKELPTKKGFGVLTIKNEADQAVLRIANTHFQSGKSEDKQRIRRSQAQQIIDYANQTPDIPFFFGGDLNINRIPKKIDDGIPNEYTETHPIHHSQEYITEGFATKTERELPTLADFEGTEGEPNRLAVDNILGVNAGDCKLTIEQRGDFDDKTNSPSDHAAILATIELGTTTASSEVCSIR